MVKRIVMVLVMAVGAGFPRPAAFAQLQDDGQPCPPECVTDSMEIVTWYPSPYSEYEELRLYPTQRDANYCDNDKIGLMYYDHGGTPSFGDDDKIKVCKGTLLGWQEVGYDTSAQAMLKLTGTNPVCPSGGASGVFMKKWNSKTCSNYVDGGGSPCNTTSGWYVSAPTCSWVVDAGGGYPDYGSTCTADSWSAVICINE